ncbi:DUF1648 domain-containing protein [Microbacterium sp. NPDC019599]|uniref:DUF1648 domain-containing protein n=1 Tax=Microbacterium sp. NPDC019599 TaxID=3154690 RepID=UPI0033E01B83
MTTDRSPALARFVLVALVLPAVITVVASLVQLVALPQLPDPVAVHWNALGQADGFASPWLYPVMTLLIAGALPALLALTSLPGLRRGDGGPTYRFMGATALGLSAFGAALLTWSLLMQVGLADATDAPTVWPALVGGLGAGALAGAAGWFLQPHVRQPAPAALPGTPIALRPGERAVWMRTTSVGRGAAAGIALGAIAVVVGAVAVYLAGAPAVTVWVLTLAAVLLVVLAATTVAFHVRVDDAGLEVRSILGFPRFRVPLADVSRAVAVAVDPMGEFGGWGIRLAPGRFGIVLRTGEAIEVSRANGRRTVVTVDDAATGAALLEALAERARSDAHSTPRKA